MKKIFTMLFALLLFSSCESCKDVNFTEECISDIAVTSLSAVGNVVLGNPLSIVCTITNLIDTFDSCTTPTATVTHAYSPTYKENFEDYEEITSETVSLEENFFANGEQFDEMPMKTDHGAGYYAMKVEVDSPNDIDPSNNSKAIALHVD